MSKKSQPGGLRLHVPPGHCGNYCIKVYKHPGLYLGLRRGRPRKGLRESRAVIALGRVLGAHREGSCLFPLDTASSCYHRSPWHCTRCQVNMLSFDTDALPSCSFTQATKLSRIEQTPCFSVVSPASPGGKDLPFLQLIIPTSSPPWDGFPQGPAPAGLKTIPS